MIELPIWLVVLSGIAHGVGLFLLVLFVGIFLFGMWTAKNKRRNVEESRPKQ